MELQEHQQQEYVRESLTRFCSVQKLYDGRLGPCAYCGKIVYWGRNRNGNWAPPFESMVLGDARPGEWVRHRTRCRHFVGALGIPTDLRSRLVKRRATGPQDERSKTTPR